MPTDSQTFLFVQLLIASAAFLCISVAYIWFLRKQVKKQKSRSPHVFEYAYDGSRVGQKKGAEKLSEIDMLGALSGEQFHLSSEIKEMTSKKEVEALSDKERERFLQHIDSLEESLKESGKQLASMKLQHRQVNCDLENEENKVANLKKVVDASADASVSVPVSGHEEESVAAEQIKQLKSDLDKKEKEIKKLRVNSSLMTKELDELKLDNFDAYQLKKDLEETEQKLKRSEAERELLESNFVELAEGSRSTKDLEDEIARMKKEYEMLEQRFIGSGAA
jgi:chromosome segregation ATPase